MVMQGREGSGRNSKNNLNILFVFFLVVILIKFVPILRLLLPSSSSSSSSEMALTFTDGSERLPSRFRTRDTAGFRLLHFIFVDVNFSSDLGHRTTAKTSLERIGSPTASVLYNAKRAGGKRAKYNDIETEYPNSPWWAWWRGD